MNNFTIFVLFGKAIEGREEVDRTILFFYSVINISDTHTNTLEEQEKNQ